MLDAICTLDGQPPITFSVFDFQRLGEQDIEACRQHLRCPACDGKAYYRKASSDGKAACFGSRYHKADCPEFNPSAQSQREQQDALEVNRQLLEADALEIDFGLAPRARPKSGQAQAVAGEKADEGGRRSQAQSRRVETLQGAGEQVLADGIAGGIATTKAEPYAAQAVKAPRVPTQGLEKLLNSLLRGSSLTESDLWVYTDPARKYRWRAKNLFVNFSDAEPSDSHRPQMYWGTVSHADKTLNWLNPADCKDLGIPIEAFREALFARFGIEDRRDLEGAGIILFGQCFWNKDKSRKIVRLWQNDLSRIFLSPLRSD